MIRPTTRGALASAAVLAALVTTTACSAPSAPAAPTTSSASASSSTHNDADVAFVSGMIPHHRQAVDMAELAVTNTTNPKILDLAGRIEKAQAPEIGTMNGFLTSWGMSPDSATGTGGMDHGSMDGMMSDPQMQQLRQARGAEFDRMFLTMMIEHHEGAVKMAQAEVSSGQNGDVEALAQTIIDAQRAEISEMSALLAAA